ncbi:MAG: hypothetical protein KF788_21845 [Piscinibacter sp.]|nr:hypothetical protein [Piscinibacter sp.]
MTDARLAWQRGRIVAREPLTARILRIELQPDTWHAARAGQHLDLRLTADDGYQAQRSYSLLSPPEQTGRYELAIERLDDGEVSPWFHEVAQPGDELELRGPLGGHFVWSRPAAPPTLLVGGGSGLVPLLAMVRHRHYGAEAAGAPMSLVAAARQASDVLLRDELLGYEAQGRGFALWQALSRADRAPRPQDRAGRLDAALLAAALQPLGAPAGVLAYLCGRHAFVEAVAALLLVFGVPAGRIRTERFGG